MAHFDHRSLQHLKKLCRLECNPEEEEKLLKGLSQILKHIDQLNEVDTEGVEPCSFVLRALLKNRMREDVATDLLSRDLFLANAPDQIGGMIRTPPVLKPPQ